MRQARAPSPVARPPETRCCRDPVHRAPSAIPHPLPSALGGCACPAACQPSSRRQRPASDPTGRRRLTHDVPAPIPAAVRVLRPPPALPSLCRAAAAGPALVLQDEGLPLFARTGRRLYGLRRRFMTGASEAQLAALRLPDEAEHVDDTRATRAPPLAARPPQPTSIHMPRSSRAAALHPRRPPTPSSSARRSLRCRRVRRPPPTPPPSLATALPLTEQETQLILSHRRSHATAPRRTTRATRRRRAPWPRRTRTRRWRRRRTPAWAHAAAAACSYLLAVLTWDRCRRYRSPSAAGWPRRFRCQAAPARCRPPGSLGMHEPSGSGMPPGGQTAAAVSRPAAAAAAAWGVAHA